MSQEPPHIVNVTVQQKRGGCSGCMSTIGGIIALLLIIGAIGVACGGGKSKSEHYAPAPADTSTALNK